MKKAIWNKAVLAQSEHTIEIEGNDYFPQDSINAEYFEDSSLQSTCPWKGEASYKSIIVNGKLNQDAAWYYPVPKEKAQEIKNYVAFWKGVEIVDS